MNAILGILLTLWRGLLSLLQIGLFIITVALQFVDPVPADQLDSVWTHLKAGIHSNRLEIAIVTGMLFALLTGWRDWLVPHWEAVHIRQTIMEAMLEELFANDKKNIRITIFKDARFRKKIWIYVKRLFSGTKGAYKIFGDYVVARERLGPTKSNAYFRFDVADERKCRGVAGVARQREDITTIYNLPDINHIDLNCEEMGKKNTKKFKVVRLYMQLCYMGDDIETLKLINRKPRHIYGNVLSNRSGQFKGVLLIDSFHENSPFDDSVLQNMPYYLKILAATL